MIEWIKNSGHLDEVKEKQKNFLILFFYGEFSSNAKRALKELEDFDKENSSMPLYIVDVGQLKGIHENYDVESVPTVLILQNGEEIRRIEGVESSQFYARILCGASSSMHKGDTKRSIHRIIVYTGAGCPACGMVKTYLRKQGVNFREIDVSRDERAAERLVRRSGQMAVPQIDIDGQLIVGFDKGKIDRLISN